MEVTSEAHKAVAVVVCLQYRYLLTAKQLLVTTIKVLELKNGITSHMRLLGCALMGSGVV